MFQSQSRSQSSGDQVRSSTGCIGTLCFNLSREANPLATSKLKLKGNIKLKFQSQTRSQSSGDPVRLKTCLACIVRFNLSREANPLATLRKCWHPKRVFSFNLSREANPLATQGQLRGSSSHRGFNLSREANPLATLGLSIPTSEQSLFQSQSRSQSSGDRETLQNDGFNVEVSISVEKPILWRL